MVRTINMWKSEHVCGEIQYPNVNENGVEEGNVHSDICFESYWPRESAEWKEDKEKWRKFVHDSVDEWIDKSNGQGFLWIGDTADISGNFGAQHV